MKRRVRRLMYVVVFTCVSFGSVGCTALANGFKDGVADGFSAALAAMIQAPINFVIDHTFNAVE